MSDKEDGLDESELVEQAKAGDLDAFERLVVLHQRAALQVAYVMAVSGLPERDRLTLAYRFFVGLSEAEMAAAMSCRPGTVKSRLARALGRLRHALPDQSPEAAYG